MKSLLSIIGAILLYVNVQAQITPEWVRYPAISPNGSHIVFTYKGDLYVTSSTGGEEVKRLTFHMAHDYMPVWSNDSKHIAFASDRYGNFDIFTMSKKEEKQLV